MTRYIIIFLLLTKSCIWAQSDGVVRSIKLRVVAFDYFEEHKALKLLNANGKVLDLSLPKNNLSVQMDYRGSGKLLFYPSDSQIGTSTSPLASVVVPEEMNSVILLFLPLKERYHVEVISDSIDRFPGGAKYFVNLSEHHVASKMGDRYIAVAPGKHELIEMGKDTKTRVHVQIAYDVGGPWQPLSSTRWTFDPRTRTILFFYYDQRLKRLRLKGIPDRVK